MGFLSTLFSAASAQPIEAVGNIIDQLYTSTEEKLEKKILLERLAQQPQLAQLEILKIEAQHRSVFVAGARPFILWVCGISLSFVFILNPLIQWKTGLPGPEIPVDALSNLVLATLGLGGMRTLEKLTGRTK